MAQQYDVLPAEKIKAIEIMNPEGENLGQIEEVFIDVEYGRIAYVAVSLGGFLGMGGQLHPIPWQAFSWSPQGKRLILNIDKQALKNAHGFDKENYSNLSDRQWAAEIFNYYGQRPYWESEQRREHTA